MKVLQTSFVVTGLLLSGPVLASQSATHDHLTIAASKDYEIESLAQNLDNAIKVCSAMAVRGGSSEKTVRRPEKAATDKGILKFFEKPPAGLAAAANPKFGSARFAQWFDPHATVYIIAYENSPVCRALVLRSEWASAVRPALYKLVMVDNFWKSTELDTRVSADQVRSVFKANSPSTVEPMLTITAKDKQVKDGQIQLSLSVSIVSKEQR